MAGISGGALAAIFAACDVDPEDVMTVAHDLALQHRVWERPAGEMVGEWGALVEAWLHRLLPEDAAQRCAGKVEVIVTQLPAFKQVAITDFKDKADLINVALTSAHVPIMLDGRLSRNCRGVACVDGEQPAQHLLYVLCVCVGGGGGGEQPSVRQFRHQTGWQTCTVLVRPRVSSGCVRARSRRC
jgi:hypothetical protein